MSNMTASSSIFTAVMFLPTSPHPPTAAISTLIFWLVSSQPLKILFIPQDYALVL